MSSLIEIEDGDLLDFKDIQRSDLEKSPKRQISYISDEFRKNEMPPNDFPKSRQKGNMTKAERRYVKGGVESIRRLKMNGFDPIDELVAKYRRLEREIDFYEQWRDGVVVPVTSDGREQFYTSAAAQNHLSIYDKLMKVSESLLRYAYGRVPENINLSAAGTKPLVINLSKDEGSYSILVNDKEED